MSDNVVVVQVDKLAIKTANVQPVQGVVSPRLSGEGSRGLAGVSSNYTGSERRMDEHVGLDEEEPLIQTVECRICQEDEDVKNLETPCGCSGSLKYAHRNCVQRWCNEKRDTTCEICHQPYQPGYTAPPLSPRSRPDDSTIDISGGWMIAGGPVDTRLLALAASERRLIETDYDELSGHGTNSAGSVLCRFAVLILLALFLLRHALDTPGAADEDVDDDVTAILSIFLLRAMGFLLPCYIMAWAIALLQRRRRGEEEAEFASEVAFVLQSSQEPGLQLTIVPGHTMATLEQLQ